MLLEQSSEFIIGRYHIKVKKQYDFLTALRIISTEESIGIESLALQNQIKIYPGITNLKRKIIKQYSARFRIVERFSKQIGMVDIYFPIKNILQQYGTINILLSTLMGDLFGLEVVDQISLEEIFWPKNYLSLFRGPKYGLKGISRLLNKKFPLFGVIIKPNLGLTPKETGSLVYKLALGGADFIKDDELLSSTATSPIFDRLGYAMEAIHKAQHVTNKNCLFAINITADSGNVYSLAKEIVKRGANCLMINVFTVGFDVLKTISEDNTISVPIHTHRCMHDIFTGKPARVRLSVFAELARICGADFFHIGTLIGQNHQKRLSIIKAHQALTQPHSQYPSTVPISSRVSIFSIEKTLKMLKSQDVLFLACGAIYKNILSIEDSVKTMVEAIEAAVEQRKCNSKEYNMTKKFLKELT